MGNGLRSANEREAFGDGVTKESVNINNRVSYLI
jgi:hypothetical protein